MARSSSHTSRMVATAAYQGVLGKSLSSSCRMFPSDSVLFDARAKRCGAAPAAVLGIARLFLETAAQPSVLPPLVVDGQARWFDPPGSDPCAL